MKRFEEINWEQWEPAVWATILFVIRDNRILLIHKKRGLGAGKVTGPGGKLDPGETLSECAQRELTEELGVVAHEVTFSGELLFQFVDGLALHVTVFRTDGCEGEPIESDEAAPLWFPVDEIPYHKMWADDYLWMPLMLAQKPFVGRFLFDDDAMVGYKLEKGPRVRKD